MPAAEANRSPARRTGGHMNDDIVIRAKNPAKALDTGAWTTAGGNGDAAIDIGPGKNVATVAFASPKPGAYTLAVEVEDFDPPPAAILFGRSRTVENVRFAVGAVRGRDHREIDKTGSRSIDARLERGVKEIPYGR